MMPLSPVPAVLHAQLRLATAAVHAELERHPLLRALTAPATTVAQYGNALAAQHGIYANAEGALLHYFAGRPGLFDYASRKKLPALESDLVLLERTPLSLRVRCPAIDDIATLCGALYVIEGATLGGQFIARQLRGQAGLVLPLRFYTIYGEQTRSRWEQTLQFASTLCTPAAHLSACAAAAAWFGAFKAQLDACQSDLLAPAGQDHPQAVAASSASMRTMT